MIVTFGSTKVGCGKTVLAINVAIIRANKGQRKTLLVDADEQGSSATFGELRIYHEDIPKQRFITDKLIEISQKYSIPVVATNNCYYIEKSDKTTQDVIQAS